MRGIQRVLVLMTYYLLIMLKTFHFGYKHNIMSLKYTKEMVSSITLKLSIPILLCKLNRHMREKRSDSLNNKKFE